MVIFSFFTYFFSFQLFSVLRGRFFFSSPPPQQKGTSESVLLVLEQVHLNKVYNLLGLKYKMNRFNR